MRISDWISDVCSSDLDDPIGFLRRRRQRQQQRKPCEAKHPGQKQEGNQALDHKIFLSAASKVWRAVRAASAIANSGSASKSAQPAAPSDAVAASPDVTPDHCQPISSRNAAATMVPTAMPEAVSLEIRRWKRRGNLRTAAPH